MDEDANCNFANFGGIGGCEGDNSEVGSYLDGRSQYGFMDMAGNVLGWVIDWMSGTYYSNSPYANPLGPLSGNYKMFRGGSWLHSGSTLCVARRLHINLPDPSAYYLGFRCTADAAP